MMSSSSAAVKLRAADLALLPRRLNAPTYARAALRRSILHIGVGAFHRSHLATYVDDVCRGGARGWGIRGCGLLPADAAAAAALGAQDCLFCVAARGAGGADVRVVGALVEYVLGVGEGARRVVEAIASAETQVVSLTITEGGYPVDDGSGEFDARSKVGGEGSAFDVIARGLDARRKGGGKGVTVLSCDNVVGNGDVARKAAYGMAALVGGEALVEWMRDNVSFPNSMVDRITPATTDEDVAWLREEYGVEDARPVMTEVFRQWVVEDRFKGERLPLEQMGAIVTSDVAPYEMMKLRLLNAGHCCLAYSARLLGFELVHDAMGDADVSRFVRAFMETEAAPTLQAAPGIQLDEYIASLLERFANPQVRDQVSRLCLDGSAKLPKFLFPTLQAQLSDGGAGRVRLAALTLASWARYLLGRTEGGEGYALSADPLLDEAVACARRALDEPRRFLELPIFGDDLRASETLLAAFERSWVLLGSRGTRVAIEEALGKDEGEHG